MVLEGGRFDTGIEHGLIGAGKRLVSVDARTGVVRTQLRANDLEPLLLHGQRLWVDHEGLEALDPRTFTVVEPVDALATRHPPLRTLRGEDRTPCADQENGRVYFADPGGAGVLVYDLQQQSLAPTTTPCPGARRAADGRAQWPDGGFFTASAVLADRARAPGQQPSHDILLAGTGDLPLVVDGDLFLFEVQGRGEQARGLLTRLAPGGGRVAWTATVPVLRVTGLARAGGVLVLGGAPRVAAIDLSTGALLWSRP